MYMYLNLMGTCFYEPILVFLNDHFWQHMHMSMHSMGTHFHEPILVFPNDHFEQHMHMFLHPTDNHARVAMQHDSLRSVHYSSRIMILHNLLAFGESKIYDFLVCYTHGFASFTR